MLKPLLAAFLFAVTLSLSASPASAAESTAAESTAAKSTTASGPVFVSLHTTKGNILLKLRPGAAPVTVRNFLHYVRKGFYDGTIFHRVIPGFMIQGGGFSRGMHKKSTDQPIKNESDNGLKNKRGTIAMARTSDPDSATSQFFINLSGNSYLNGKPGHPGYAVFGKVIKGMKVVDAITQVPTGQEGPYRNVPKKPVVIDSAKVVNAPGKTGKSGQ